MPRLPGISPTDTRLTYLEQIDIARAMGQNLAQMQTLTWPFAGDYDLATNTIQPFDKGFSHWFASDVLHRLEKAQEHRTVDKEDVIWIDQIVSDALPALATNFQPCFVMNDYNPNNMAVNDVNGEWQVTGLFDLMEYYFGDGEADLMRLIAHHLGSGQPHGTSLARAFGKAYFESRPARPGFAERFKLFMLRDRLIIWEYGTRPEADWFPEGRSFRDYAEGYTATYTLFEADLP